MWAKLKRFFANRWVLASKSDPVFNALAAIHSDVGDLKRAPPPPPPPAAPGGTSSAA